MAIKGQHFDQFRELLLAFLAEKYGFSRHLCDSLPDTFRTELMQWLQRIIGGDYHDLAQNGVSCGRGDCREFHLEKNQIFPSMDALRQHAEDLYPDGYIPDIVGKNMVGEIRAIRVLFERTGKEWQSAPLR